MKRIYIIGNAILVLIIGIFVLVKPTQRNIAFNNNYKSLTTSSFHSIALRKVSNEKEVVKNDTLSSVAAKLENNFTNNTSKAGIISDVLEKQYGTMSAYGPDCSGCSGRLGGGYDARGGNTTYQDREYGTVRIVAGDPKYPYGTIVRVKGIGNDFNVIVLDRGGDIGIGRRFMFDLLCASEAQAASFGTHYNLTFEVLRYGY